MYEGVRRYSCLAIVCNVVRTSFFFLDTLIFFRWCGICMYKYTNALAEDLRSRLCIIRTVFPKPPAR